MTAPDRLAPEPAVRTPAQKRRRFWARLGAFVLGGLFVLPTVLQTEPAPGRADAVQVADSGSGGPGGRRSASRGAHGRKAAPTSRPFYGGVREAPLSELETLSSLGARGENLPHQASFETASPQIEDFSTPAAAISESGPFALPSPPIDPVGGTGGVAPPITTNPGNPTTPPVIVPPVVTPPVVTPPVITPPVVTPPVVTPPVVDPTPPVVIPPSPPTVDPGFPSGPGGGGPGGPGTPGGPGVIPEPATWIQLILGAGMVGAMLRRRRTQPLTALRARSRALAAVSRLG